MNSDICTECVGFHDSQSSAPAFRLAAASPTPPDGVRGHNLFWELRKIEANIPAAEGLPVETPHSGAGEAAE